MSKTIRYKSTYNDSIIEFSFVTQPGRGWFKENVQPIVDIIKAQIPATAREYNHVTYTWSIDANYFPPVKTVSEAFGWAWLKERAQQHNVEVPKSYAENFYRAPEPQHESTENIAAQLSLFLGVSITTQDLAELKKLYRRKAIELHPDRGGDAAQMSELNRLWTLWFKAESERVQ